MSCLTSFTFIFCLEQSRTVILFTIYMIPNANPELGSSTILALHHVLSCPLSYDKAQVPPLWFINQPETQDDTQFLLIIMIRAAQ